MKKAIALMITGIIITSCVSQKKFTELEELQQNTKKSFGFNICEAK